MPIPHRIAGITRTNCGLTSVNKGRCDNPQNDAHGDSWPMRPCSQRGLSRYGRERGGAAHAPQSHVRSLLNDLAGAISAEFSVEPLARS